MQWHSNATFQWRSYGGTCRGTGPPKLSSSLVPKLNFIHLRLPRECHCADFAGYFLYSCSVHRGFCSHARYQSHYYNVFFRAVADLGRGAGGARPTSGLYCLSGSVTCILKYLSRFISTTVMRIRANVPNTRVPETVISETLISAVTRCLLQAEDGLCSLGAIH